MCLLNFYTGCPTRYRTRHFFNNFTTPLLRVATIRHTTDTFLFHFSHNERTPVQISIIFIGVRIIKEMPCSVASGTHCITQILTSTFFIIECISRLLKVTDFNNAR